MNLPRACLVLTFVPSLLGAIGADKMSPLSSYLIDRQTEIGLARSAAPPSISGQATIMVLTPHGYVVAALGSNGFTCLVERAWMQPFDMVPFWSPRIQAPVCYNRQASRTVLLYTFKRTALALAGTSREAMLKTMTAAVADGTLPALPPGTMAYMMSRSQRLNTGEDPSWYPHVMFYEPKATGSDAGAAFGADLPRSPVAYDSAHHLTPEPWAVFYVPVAHWSDGSTAPVYTGT